MTTTSTAGWRGGMAQRLRRLAVALSDDLDAPGGIGARPEAVEAPTGPGATLARRVEEAEGESADDFAARRLHSVIEELYPTVAARVLALAEAGPGADVDEWVAVARLLYDAHMHRVGGPSIEARQQALLATLGQALEAQARSSARLAGYTDEDLARPSTFDGDAAGTLLWEHYLCPPARLARSALHGESVGDWLGALGDLWSASDALYQLVAADASVRAAGAGDDPDDERAALLERAKVALVRVQELSLW